MSNSDNNGDDNNRSVGHWIYNRMTSYNKRMFTRVYKAVNGVVELHVHKTNINEAVEWARLATSEIAMQLSNQSMIEVVTNPQEAFTGQPDPTERTHDGVIQFF